MVQIIAALGAVLFVSIWALESGRPRFVLSEDDAAALRDRVIADLGLNINTPWNLRTRESRCYPRGVLDYRTNLTSESWLLVSISKTDGSIAHVAYWRDKGKPTRTPEKVEIGEADAIRRAEQWIEKWAPRGMDNLEFEEVHFIEDRNEWGMTWRRAENGIRFREDKTWVVIRADDGALLNFRREMFLDLPNNSTNKPYPKTKAIKKARRFARFYCKGIMGCKPEDKGVKFETGEINVIAIQPYRDDTVWDRLRTRIPWISKGQEYSSQTRLAYQIMVGWKLAEPPQSGKYPMGPYIVTIDYKTGKHLDSDGVLGVVIL